MPHPRTFSCAVLHAMQERAVALAKADGENVAAQAETVVAAPSKVKDEMTQHESDDPAKVAVAVLRRAKSTEDTVEAARLYEEGATLLRQACGSSKYDEKQKRAVQKHLDTLDSQRQQGVAKAADGHEPAVELA